MKNIIFISALCFSSVVTAQVEITTTRPQIIILQSGTGRFVRVNPNKILYYEDFYDPTIPKVNGEITMEDGRIVNVYETPADIDIMLGIEYSGVESSEKRHQQCKVK
jgi:hypothetical protein